MANEIVTEIRLELDKFRADLAAAQKAGEDTGKNAGKGLGDGIEAGFSAGWVKVAGALAAAGASIAAAFSLKDSIQAAAEQETANNNLNLSLAMSGQYSAQASAGFLHLAESLQITTTASKNTVAQGAALIENLGHLSGEGLQRATKDSLDLAAALGVDQSTAFNLVAKAASGHTSALSRYGITVKETGDKTRDFNTALTLLEARFQGLAELQANTFSGALTQTKNQFGEVLEAVGNIIVQSPTTIAFLKAIAQAFTDMASGIAKFAEGRDLIGELSTALITLGQGITTYVIAPFELLYNIVNIAVDGIKTLIQGVVVAITDAVGTITGILAPLGGKFAEINDSVKAFADSSTAVLGDFKNQTEQSFDNLFNFNATAAADKFLASAQEFVDEVQPTLKTDFQALSDKSKPQDPGFFAAFAQGFVSASKTMEAAATQLGATIHATIQTGVTNAFAAMGAALEKGENGFAAFGKAMIGVLGDIAIQAGSTFIGLGIAKAIASVGTDPSAYALIAAGGALAVLGGALKAYAGGGGGGPAAASADTSGGGVATAGSGASGTAPTSDSGPTTFNDSQRNTVGTAVTVNVSGGVYGDKKAAGMEIADAINEAFGSSGVTFAQGAAS